MTITNETQAHDIHTQFHNPHDAKIRYVHPNGNDSDDGLTWATPKETILGAYDSLGSSSGTIYIASLSHVGGEVQGQGIWLAASGDPNIGSMSFSSGSYPGWRKSKAVKFVGVDSLDSGTLIQAGQPGDTNWTGPWIWLSSDCAELTFENLVIWNGYNPYGIDFSRYSNGADATGYGAAFIKFRNVFSRCESANGLNGYNPWRLGNSAGTYAAYWIYLDHCRGGWMQPEPVAHFQNTVSASTQGASDTWVLTEASPVGFPASTPFVIQSDKEQVLVTVKNSMSWTVKRGYRNTPADQHNDDHEIRFDPEDKRRAVLLITGTYLTEVRTFVAYYGNVHIENSEGKIRLTDIQLESSSAPVVTVVNTGFISMNHIEGYDLYAGTWPRGIVTIDPPTQDPSLVTIESVGFYNGRASEVIGPAFTFSHRNGFGVDTSMASYDTPLARGQIGFDKRRIMGQHDSARRSFGPVTAIATNLIDQTGASWVGIGEGTAGPVTTGITGPDGLANAVAIAGDLTKYRVIYSGSWNPSAPNSRADGRVGDYLFFGTWIKAGSVGDMPYSYAPEAYEMFYIELSSGNATFAYGPFATEGATTITMVSPHKDGGNWTWVYGYARARTAGATTLKWRSAGNLYYAYPMLFTKTGIHESEAAELGTHMATFPDGAALGAMTTARNQKLIARGGLGVGNSASATTLDSVVKKMEVFDASGNSLGFVPIYNDIT